MHSELLFFWFVLFFPLALSQAACKTHPKVFVEAAAERPGCCKPCLPPKKGLTHRRAVVGQQWHASAHGDTRFEFCTHPRDRSTQKQDKMKISLPVVTEICFLLREVGSLNFREQEAVSNSADSFSACVIPTFPALFLQAAVTPAPGHDSHLPGAPICPAPPPPPPEPHYHKYGFFTGAGELAVHLRTTPYWKHGG